MVAWGLSSCQDWLTITPTTQIVEDDFWEDKSDLEGVRYAAYQQMCNTISSLILWGDLRADTYELNANDGDKDTYALYQDIWEARMERDSANAYFDWSGIYRTINYCNKVLQHGPEVLQRDKQFTTTEWLQIKSEVTTLRALNYFYLIRAFKDVPYTTRVVNNDTEVAPFGATDQLVILDSLIAELEEDPSIINQARRRFDATRYQDTKTLITKPAILAILSDMYLWRASLRQGRAAGDLNASDDVTITNVPSSAGKVVTHTVRGDYEKCIDYGRRALKELREQNTGGSESFSTNDYLITGLEKENVYLYKNDFEGFASSGTPPSLDAFRNIFSGLSDETFFELPFSTSEKREHSLCRMGSEGGIWGNSSKSHLFISLSSIRDILTETNAEKRDSRMWFSAWEQIGSASSSQTAKKDGKYYCFKWSGGRCALSVIGDQHKCEEIYLSPTISSMSNVPIYRISDVMLQIAEALAVLGKKEVNDSYDHPLIYVNAIHRRWHCPDYDNDNPIQTDTTGLHAFYKSSDKNTTGNISKPARGDSYEMAVLNERKLEFIGEGKRWFDMVRYAERHDDGVDGHKGVETMTDDLMGWMDDSTRKGLYSRMQNRWGLYNLIYYKEIQAAHGLLSQNPVWNKSKYEK